MATIFESLQVDTGIKDVLFPQSSLKIVGFYGFDILVGKVVKATGAAVFIKVVVETSQVAHKTKSQIDLCETNSKISTVDSTIIATRPLTRSAYQI